MVYCTWNNHVFGLFPLSDVSKKHNVLEFDLFPSSGKVMGAPTLLGPLEGANLSHCPVTVTQQSRSPHQFT
jgi:hypothetical protein